MKAILTYTLTILFVLAILLAGLSLPEHITLYFDQTTMEKAKVESIEPFEIATSSEETSIIDKIGLLNGFSTKVTQVPLETGTNFNAKSAKTRLFKEISELKDLGLFPNISKFKKSKVTTSMYVDLFVKNDAPSVNAVLWTAIIQGDNSLYGSFHLDDNTGKILDFIIVNPKTLKDTDANIPTLWANYLGLEVSSVHNEPSESRNYIEERKRSTSTTIDFDESAKTTTTRSSNYKLQTYLEHNSIRCNNYYMDLALGDKSILYDISIFENGYAFGMFNDWFKPYIRNTESNFDLTE